MCFDPLTLAGAGLSIAGGIGQRKAQDRYQGQMIDADTQQLKQNHLEALERNKVLDQYMARQDNWIGENQTDLTAGVNPFTQGNQTVAYNDNTAKRGAAISDAFGAAPASADNLVTDSTPNFLKADLTKRLGDVFTDGAAAGQRLARVGSYGDTMAGNQRSITDTNSSIQTRNNVAKGNLALLPSEQDFAGFQQRKPIWRPAGADVPTWATIAPGVGNMLGAMGGSGRFSLGNVFGSTQPMNMPAAPNNNQFAWMNGGIWPT